MSRDSLAYLVNHKSGYFHELRVEEGSLPMGFCALHLRVAYLNLGACAVSRRGLSFCRWSKCCIPQRENDRIHCLAWSMHLMLGSCFRWSNLVLLRSWFGNLLARLVKFPNDYFASDFSTKAFPSLNWQFVRKHESAGPFDGFERHLKVGQAF